MLSKSLLGAGAARPLSRHNCCYPCSHRVLCIAISTSYLQFRLPLLLLSRNIRPDQGIFIHQQNTTKQAKTQTACKARLPRDRHLLAIADPKPPTDLSRQLAWFLARALCVLLTTKQPRRTVIPVDSWCRARRLHALHHANAAAATTLRQASSRRRTTRTTAVAVHRRALSLPCLDLDVWTSRTPDAPARDRIAHIVTRHALGYGDQQSVDCASHRWRAQTCSAEPERSRPVQTGPGELVEAVQEERQEAAGPGRYAHIFPRRKTRSDIGTAR